MEINQSIYIGSLYSFHNTVSQREEKREDFILDRRLFINKESKEIESHYSLIIDTAITEDYCDLSIGFDNLYIRNVGYSLSKITIDSIEFSLGTQKRLLEQTERNCLYLNMRQNDEISILVSGKFGKIGYQPFDVESLNDDSGEYAEKLSAIKGSNLLNTRCISEADSWDEIKVVLKTENLYGREYIQTVKFNIVSNTYYIKVSEPRPIIKNPFNKFINKKSNI